MSNQCSAGTWHPFTLSLQVSFFTKHFVTEHIADTCMMLYHSAEDKSVLFADMVQSPADNQDTELVLSVTAEMLDRHRCKQVDKADIQPPG